MTKMAKIAEIGQIQLSRYCHVTDHFRIKSLFFRDTRDKQEQAKKYRLPIPG